MASMAASTPPVAGEPAWDVARLFPSQGNWSEEEYLFVTNQSNRLAELVDGRLEVLPMPTLDHQRILIFLFEVLKLFVKQRSLGEVLVAPLRVRLRPDLMREPDIVFVLDEHAHRKHKQYFEGADLVMEVVSEDDPKRDLVEKRREYAAAGIPEYWIVDPAQQRITVLRLNGKQYDRFAEGTGSGRVTSALLPGFTVDVAEVFAAAGGDVN